MARMDRRVVEGPPLVVTIPGRECQLTVADVGGMPAEEYRLLWTVCLYARIDSSPCTRHFHVVLTPQQVYALYSSSQVFTALTSDLIQRLILVRTELPTCFMVQAYCLHVQGYVTGLQTCLDIPQAAATTTTKRRLATLVWEALRLKCQRLICAVQPSLMARPDLVHNPALYLIVSLQAPQVLQRQCIHWPRLCEGQMLQWLCVYWPRLCEDQTLQLQCVYWPRLCEGHMWQWQRVCRPRSCAFTKDIVCPY